MLLLLKRCNNCLIYITSSYEVLEDSPTPPAWPIDRYCSQEKNCWLLPTMFEFYWSNGNSLMMFMLRAFIEMPEI